MDTEPKNTEQEEGKNYSSSSKGPATDAVNRPVIDPTENVMKLVAASNKRQDDLRVAYNERIDCVAVEVSKRIDSELRHLEVVADLRAAHSKEMRELESRRLDAIRQVDVTAVKTEADRALAAIQALAVTTAANAENLRTALQNTAQTIAKQTSDTVQQITERIAALEKSSYEGAGKSQVADPAISDLIHEVRNMKNAQATFGGERRGVGQSWGVVLGAVSLIATLLGIGSVIIAVSRSSNPPATIPTQTVYVPAPTGTLVPGANVPRSP